MKHLLLLYASQTGRTLQLVDAVRASVAQLADDLQFNCLPAEQATLDDLLTTDGIVLATPENFGYMAGKIKDFFDRTFYPAQGRTEGLACLLLVSAGNDGMGAVHAMRRIIAGYGWHEVLPAVVVRGEPDAAQLAEVVERAEQLVAGMLIGRW